jgi:hypothetical protein
MAPRRNLIYLMEKFIRIILIPGHPNTMLYYFPVSKTSLSKISFLRHRKHAHHIYVVYAKFGNHPNVKQLTVEFATSFGLINSKKVGFKPNHLGRQERRKPTCESEGTQSESHLHNKFMLHPCQLNSPHAHPMLFPSHILQHFIYH